jgi:hypothetical protein
MHGLKRRLEQYGLIRTFTFLRDISQSLEDKFTLQKQFDDNCIIETFPLNFATIKNGTFCFYQSMLLS